MSEQKEKVGPCLGDACMQRGDGIKQGSFCCVAVPLDDWLDDWQDDWQDDCFVGCELGCTDCCVADNVE